MGAGSMEIIYQQMYQRSEILISKQVEIAEQVKRRANHFLRLTAGVKAGVCVQH
jgi:hypothetical protein